MKYGLLSNIYDYAEDIKTCVSSITTYWPGYKEILQHITDNARKIQTYAENADDTIMEKKTMTLEEQIALIKSGKLPPLGCSKDGLTSANDSKTK